jgi:hypothetical protein
MKADSASAILRGLLRKELHKQESSQRAIRPFLQISRQKRPRQNGKSAWIRKNPATLMNRVKTCKKVL